MNLLPLIVAAAAWWVHGPDQAVREIRQLLRDGSYAELEAMVAAEDRWVLVLLQESDLEPASLSWFDLLEGMRRFQTIEFFELSPKADLIIRSRRIRAIRIPPMPPVQLGQAFHSLRANPLGERLKRADGWLKTALKATPDDKELISKLYLFILNRQPTDEERQAMADHFAKEQNRELAGEDVAWALFQSREFLWPKGK